MAATGVLFDFSKPVSEAFWQTLQEELDRTAAQAWPDHSLQWMKREEFHGGMEYPEIIQVRLQGHCKADLTTDWQFADGPLGWVYMTGGEIQPVVYVNCDRIGQTLEHELRGANCKERGHRRLKQEPELHRPGEPPHHVVSETNKHVVHDDSYWREPPTFFRKGFSSPATRPAGGASASTICGK